MLNYGNPQNPFVLGGGAQGRPNHLHMGFTGVNRGGLNAQGSVRGVARPHPFRPPVAPAPHGYFQYGHNQYGYSNGNGQIDWHAPQQNFNNALKHHNVVDYNSVSKYANQHHVSGKPSQANPGPYYADWIYRQHIADAGKQHNDLVAQNNLKLAQANTDYMQNLNQMGMAHDQQHNQLASNLASRGFFGPSGSVDATFGMDAQGYSDQVQNAGAEFNKFKDLTQQEVAQSAAQLKLTKQQELEDAKHRWLQSGKPAPAPDPNLGKFHKQGNQWFYTNKNGATVSVAHPSVGGLLAGGGRYHVKPRPHGSVHRVG